MATKPKLLDALKKNAGNISAACAAVGIGRQTFYDWKKADAEFAEAVDETSEQLLDDAESALYDQIFGNKEKGIKPQLAAQIFYLKTKGKKRGYVERQEVTGADGKDFVLPIPVFQIPAMVESDRRESE